MNATTPLDLGRTAFGVLFDTIETTVLSVASLAMFALATVYTAFLATAWHGALTTLHSLGHYGTLLGLSGAVIGLYVCAGFFLVEARHSKLMTRLV